MAVINVLILKKKHQISTIEAAINSAHAVQNLSF